MLKNKIQYSIYILTSLIVGLSILYSNYLINNRLDIFHDQHIEIEKIVRKIEHYDEILTSSARLAAFSGDLNWENRYRETEPKLDVAINRALEIASFGSEKTNNANIALVELENAAFEFLRDGKIDAAQSVITSDEYEIFKNKYHEGLNEFYDIANKKIRKLDIETNNLIIRISYINLFGVFFVAFMTYVGVRSITQNKKQEILAQEYRHLASIGRLSSGMAHEINNALQPIMGMSDILRFRLSKNEEMKDELDKIETIYNNSIHAREIVENIQAHSKGIQSQQEIYDAFVTFKDCISLASQGLSENVKIRKDFSKLASDLKLRLNKTDTTQIFRNIMKNAAESMNFEGDIFIKSALFQASAKEAEARGIDEGSYCVIHIIDTGRGMNKSTREAIFEPFFTTKEAAGGTGLGLSISYGFMRQLGGTIVVKSSPGKGSTFSLYFPIIEE